MEETTALLLRFECDRLDLLTDELFLHDVLTVLDDPRYFIFEEELKELGMMIDDDDCDCDDDCDDDDDDDDTNDDDRSRMIVSCF